MMTLLPPVFTDCIAEAVFHEGPLLGAAGSPRTAAAPARCSRARVQSAQLGECMLVFLCGCLHGMQQRCINNSCIPACRIDRALLAWQLAVVLTLGRCNQGAAMKLLAVASLARGGGAPHGGALPGEAHVPLAVHQALLAAGGCLVSPTFNGVVCQQRPALLSLTGCQPEHDEAVQDNLHVHACVRT
jgi:hypothetical protein